MTPVVRQIVTVAVRAPRQSSSWNFVPKHAAKPAMQPPCVLGYVGANDEGVLAVGAWPRQAEYGRRKRTRDAKMEK